MQRNYPCIKFADISEECATLPKRTEIHEFTSRNKGIYVRVVEQKWRDKAQLEYVVLASILRVPIEGEFKRLVASYRAYWSIITPPIAEHICLGGEGIVPNLKTMI